MVTYGAMARQPVSVPPSLLIFKDLRLRGFALSMNSTRESKAALLEQVVPLAEKGLFCSPRCDAMPSVLMAVTTWVLNI